MDIGNRRISGAKSTDDIDLATGDTPDAAAFIAGKIDCCTSFDRTPDNSLKQR